MRAPYADGTPRRKSVCLDCDAKQKRTRSEERALHRINAVEAPMRAATRLLEQNPEAMAMLVQRFHYEFIPLLDEERQKLLRRRNADSARERARAAAKRKEASKVA